MKVCECMCVCLCVCVCVCSSVSVRVFVLQLVPFERQHQPFDQAAVSDKHIKSPDCTITTPATKTSDLFQSFYGRAASAENVFMFDSLEEF